MSFSRLVAVFAAFILIVSTLGNTVFALGTVSGARLEEKMEEGTFTLADKSPIQYRIYRSPGYDRKNDKMPAMTVIYFHGDSGKGEGSAAQFKERGFLNQLVSDSADVSYARLPYIVISVQCPEGKSFVNVPTDGSAYTFDQAAETELMFMVEQLRQEIFNGETVCEKVVVAGVGSGATAAFDYTCRYTSKVYRCVTAGGVCDPLKMSTVADSGIYFLTFGEESNTYVKQFAQATESGITYKAVPGDLGACVEYALAYNEPDITNWATQDAYENRYFKIEVYCTEAGGKISAPASVKFNGKADVVLTLNKGYSLSKLSIDGEEEKLSQLVQTKNNKNQYTLSLSNVRWNRSVNVELVRVEADTDAPVEKFVLWLSVAAAALLAVALGVFAFDYFKRKKA